MRRIVTRVLAAAEVVTVPSDHMRDVVHALTEPTPAPVAVFQYGVETTRLAMRGDEIRADDTSRDIPGRPLRIVSARALLQLYRIDVVLDALARLRDRGVRFTCDIVGDGPARAALEQQSRTLGLERCIQFHGHQPPIVAEQMIARSDVYVSVAESDGLSIALLEALALGVVPVLSDIAANRSWVNDGESGVLVNIEPQALADGIERAAGLDRFAAAQANLRSVFERADRDANLGACELLLDSLVGVVYEPAADIRRGADSDAA
jgi:glycosyltransferase involved in cell wall biosynthesis